MTTIWIGKSTYEYFPEFLVMVFSMSNLKKPASGASYYYKDLRYQQFPTNYSDNVPWIIIVS